MQDVINHGSEPVHAVLRAGGCGYATLGELQVALTRTGPGRWEESQQAVAGLAAGSFSPCQRLLFSGRALQSAQPVPSPQARASPLLCTHTA